MPIKLVSESDGPAKPAEVVTLDDALIKDLRDKKILREDEEQIDLPPFEPGQTKIGELTTPERAIFIEICVLDATLADWEKEISARLAERTAEAIRGSDTPEIMRDKVLKSSFFIDESEAEEFFETAGRKNYLENMFWYSLRKRLQCFGYYLSINYGFAVAKAASKYKLQPGG